MKILVVDDEQDICEILRFNLEKEGYEVDSANSAEEALALIGTMHSGGTALYPDLILLDVMMGEMSGFQMVQKLRQNPKTEHIPVIFITALDGEDQIVEGLNYGADDYIAKPLSMKEVKARVRAVLRRSVSGENGQEKVPPSANEFSYEGIILNLDAKVATLDGEPLLLTKLEFELLSLFLQHPNKVFGRNDLLAHCWPQDVYVLDRTVDVNITRLRKKMGEYGKHIKTRVGYGYCFEK